MLDQILWAVGGTLIGGGSLKGMSAYLSYRARTIEPELSEDEKVRRAIEAPLKEPEKTQPEDCRLFVDRLFEQKLVDAGVMKPEEMSICEDGINCPECGKTAKRRQQIAKAERDRRAAEKQAEIERLSRERRAKEHLERMAKYEREKWHAIKDDNGKVTGYIRQVDTDGDYIYESMATGKRKVIRKADARRYCKKCWQPLRRVSGAALGSCPRGCEQEIPKDRVRVIEGYQVTVPEKVPFDAFGKIDRSYRARDGIYAVVWKWINPGNGETMSMRSLHAKNNMFKVTAMDEARANMKEANRPKAITSTSQDSTRKPSTARVTSGDANKTYGDYYDYKKRLLELERSLDKLENKYRKYL